MKGHYDLAVNAVGTALSIINPLFRVSIQEHLGDGEGAVPIVGAVIRHGEVTCISEVINEFPVGAVGNRVVDDGEFHIMGRKANDFCPGECHVVGSFVSHCIYNIHLKRAVVKSFLKINKTNFRGIK